jgi:hypothetical protein
MEGVGFRKPITPTLQYSSGPLLIRHSIYSTITPVFLSRAG